MVNNFIYHWRSPKIDEIIGFKAPIDLSYAYDSEYLSCKRIIAVAGDIVKVTNTNIEVNGIKRTFDVPANIMRNLNTNYGADYLENIGKTVYKYGVDKPYYVPEGHLFVIGDNYQFSLDSRNYGAIPCDIIEGRVIKILWPLQDSGIVR